jgi:predicted RNA polymerase sigma factor
VDIYDQLLQVMPSPIVELNRAVAVSMASGPEAALDVVDALAKVPMMKSYHLVPAVRGDLLERLGRLDDARKAFKRAATLARNEREKQLLLERAAACGS